MQRVRIGVTGLAAVFLLVLLAAALIGTLHRDQAAQHPAAGAARPADSPKEPLAELGVAPGYAPPAAADPPANTAALPSPAAPSRPR